MANIKGFIATEPLESNNRVIIDKTVFVIEKCLSRGSSFITYTAYKEHDKTIPYIVKEYIPSRFRRRIKRLYDKDNDLFIGIEYESVLVNKKKESFKTAKHVYDEMIKHTKSNESEDNGEIQSRDLMGFLLPYNNLVEDDNYFVLGYEKGLSVSTVLCSNRNTYTEHLYLLKKTAEICERFYNTTQKYICYDFKPDNIYLDNDINFRIMFPDYDSFISLASPPDQLLSSAGYAPPEFYMTKKSDSNEKIEDGTIAVLDTKNINETSIVYSLGVLLFEITFGTEFRTFLKDNSTDGFLAMPIDFDSDNNYNCFHYGFGDVYEKLEINKKNNNSIVSVPLDITSKNWLFDIWKKSINQDPGMRYHTITEFLKDLDVLVDLVDGNGCHPAVILKKILEVREQEKEDGIFNPDNIEESLLTEVKPIE